MHLPPTDIRLNRPPNVDIFYLNTSSIIQWDGICQSLWNTPDNSVFYVFAQLSIHLFEHRSGILLKGQSGRSSLACREIEGFHHRDDWNMRSDLREMDTREREVLCFYILRNWHCRESRYCLRVSEWSVERYHWYICTYIYVSGHLFPPLFFVSRTRI